MILLHSIKSRWHGAGGDTKELALASLLAFVVRALGAVSGFIATFAIARALGAEESGYYFLAFSVVAMLSAFGRIGLDNTLLKHTGATPEAAASILKRSLVLSSIVSGLVALVLVFGAGYVSTEWFAKPELEAVLKGVSLGVVGLSLLTLVAMSLQGLRRVVASIVVLSIGVNLLLVVSLALFGIKSSSELAWVYSASTCLVFIAGLVFVWFGKRPTHYETISYAAIWHSCAPLWIVVVMNQVLTWGGQFVAGAYSSSEEVALLAVAQRTANLVTFVLIAVNLVVAPRFAAFYKQQNYAQLQRVATLSVKLMAGLASPVILVMIIVPDWIMGLFGAEFAAGGYLLRILAIGQFINVLSGSVGYLLMMSGHERDLRNITLVVGPLSLLLAIVLTNFFGVFGAALATAIGISSQNLAAVWMVNRRLGFNTLAFWRTN